MPFINIASANIKIYIWQCNIQFWSIKSGLLLMHLINVFDHTHHEFHLNKVLKNSLVMCTSISKVIFYSTEVFCWTQRLSLESLINHNCPMLGYLSEVKDINTNKPTACWVFNMFMQWNPACFIKRKSEISLSGFLFIC